MKAAVCSPGPSVQRYPINGELRISEKCAGSARPYDIVVGVNRAAGMVRCDYWCMLDHFTYDLIPVIGRPVIVCHAGIYSSMRTAYAQAKEHRHLSIETIPLEYSEPIAWRTWSATCAIVTAFHVGATVIECYGMDWLGTTDSDGFTHPKHRRSSKRWASEKKLFDRMVPWLAAQGCHVQRVGLT